MHFMSTTRHRHADLGGDHTTPTEGRVTGDSDSQRCLVAHRLYPDGLVSGSLTPFALKNFTGSPMPIAVRVKNGSACLTPSIDPKYSSRAMIELTESGELMRELLPVGARLIWLE
jgi:hypothetical protein